MSHYRMFTKNQIKEIAKEVASLLTENKEDKVNLNQDVIEIKFTSDDFNEKSGLYEKRANLINGQLYQIVPPEGITLNLCQLFSENLLSVSEDIVDAHYIDSFTGLTGVLPEERNIVFNESMIFVVIQGHLMSAIIEV